jgi:hypothetical protein
LKNFPNLFGYVAAHTFPAGGEADDKKAAAKRASGFA